MAKVDDKVHEREQEALTFQKLLGDRIEMMSTSFRAALDNHRADIESQLASAPTVRMRRWRSWLRTSSNAHQAGVTGHS